MGKRHMQCNILIGFVIGLIVHLYMITNKLPLADDVAFSMGKNNGMGITSGRWFLEWYHISGGWNVPMIRGALALLFGSIAIALLLDLWQIKKREVSVLFALLFWSYPFVASVFTQMYMADVYFLGVLFSTLGVYIFSKKQNFWGFALSIICFAFSTGIYQALIQFAIIIFLCTFILNSLISDDSLFVTIKKAVLICVSLMSGVFLYAVILKLELRKWGVRLTEYQGISSMSHFSIRAMVRGAINGYKGYLDGIFSTNGYGFSSIITSTINVICIIAIVFGMIYFMKEKSMPWLKCVLLFFALLLFPLGINFIFVMAPNAYIYSLQKVQYMFLPMFSLAILNRLNQAENFLGKEVWKRLVGYVVIGALLVSSFVGFSSINKVYYKLQQNFYNTYAYYVELIANMKTQTEYSPQKMVYFMGSPDVSDELVDSDIMREIYGYGWSFTNEDLVSRSVYGQTFCCYYLGLNGVGLSDEEREEVLSSKAFKQANVYPQDGFLVEYKDYLIVKLNEEE